jgi:hypothetical protein
MNAHNLETEPNPFEASFATARLSLHNKEAEESNNKVGKTQVDVAAGNRADSGANVSDQLPPLPSSQRGPSATTTSKITLPPLASVSPVPLHGPFPSEEYRIAYSRWANTPGLGMKPWDRLSPSAYFKGCMLSSQVVPTVTASSAAVNLFVK